MNYIGIDIGSTATKLCIIEGETGNDPRYQVFPTGWNSKITSGSIREKDLGNLDDTKIIATGYGRISVEYADKNVTEITCHGLGGYTMAEGEDCSIIDVGGQDTKFINVQQGKVVDFLMNDKCAAGTGKFIEVMADRMGLTIEELFALAKTGEVVPISSLCTVFAESEVINYMGEGKKREDLAAGVIDSVARKVANLVKRRSLLNKVILTGGLSDNPYFAELLSAKLGHKVLPLEDGRFAGALGAALLARRMQ